MAIKQKVIPVFYNSKSRILYFDSIEDFNPKNFKFLKYARGPFAKHATHMINFNDLNNPMKVEGENANSNLVKLIKNIEIMCLNEKILFGIPLNLQEEMKIEPVEDNELEQLKYAPERDSND